MKKTKYHAHYNVILMYVFATQVLKSSINLNPSGMAGLLQLPTQPLVFYVLLFLELFVESQHYNNSVLQPTPSQFKRYYFLSLEDFCRIKLFFRPAKSRKKRHRILKQEGKNGACNCSRIRHEGSFDRCRKRWKYNNSNSDRRQNGKFHMQ